MTPEEFRKYIVILLAATLVTIWVGMGLKLYKVNKYGTGMQGAGMMRQMPKKMERRRQASTRVRPKKVQKSEPTTTSTEKK